MTHLKVRPWYAFAGGVVVTLAVAAAMGAVTTATTVTPRYATQTIVFPGMGGGPALVVTDNQTNKVYMYSPVEKAKGPEFKLGFSIDLSQAGQAVMKGVDAPKPVK